MHVCQGRSLVSSLVVAAVIHLRLEKSDLPVAGFWDIQVVTILLTLN